MDLPAVRQTTRWRVFCFYGVVVVGVLLFGSCRTTMTPTSSSPPRRDINAVLADHDDELMALPGVVGVYVGLLDDEKTLCLKIMLLHKDIKLEQALPRQIEGYPVVAEVTGPIQPVRR